MRLKTLIVILLLLSGAASAQENIYDASTVPKELLPYASAVVRNAQEAVEVKDPDNVIHYVKKVITVFNKNGDYDASIVLEYDKLTSIRYVKGMIYDATGNPVSKFSEKEFKDQYNEDGYSLYQDDHLKYYIPPATQYPYTIEYEYEVRYKQTMDLPGWEPNPSTGVAVENSKFSFSCRPDFNIRYKEINMPSSVNISTGKDGIKTYEWSINRLKAVRAVQYEPLPYTYLSEVKIAPEKFEYDGTTGSFTNWNELGKFINDKLLVNRQTVSPGTADYIKQLIAGTTDPKQKAKKIYEYMQGRTRYVSIQVGIGGFQPFSAEDVDNYKYGDCKALVNYTQALLKIAGVESWYCVVKSGDKKISFLNDFASMDQGDHIILCLPFKNDTTWCDCTSETIPFGYLGTFTDDRTVLACTPQGGKLMHTPKYTTDDNSITSKTSAKLSTDGSITADINTAYKGAEYEDLDYIIQESPTEKNKEMQRRYPISNMQVEKLDIVQDKSLHPVTDAHLSIKAYEYASVNDGKIYFLPNLTHRITEIPRQVHNRATDTYINDGITEDDEVTFTIPDGYKLQSEPSNFENEKSFGIYKTTTTIDGNKLVYHRIFKLIDGTYSKDTYSDLVDFFQDAYDSDGQNLILVKK
jgi:hypothetical protein